LLGTALDTFRLDVGDYPDQLAELRASDKRGWDGPYLPKAIPLDPWGNPYVYQKPGPNGLEYSLQSLGKDGQIGGTEEAADITNE